MKTHSICLSGYVRGAIISGVLFMAVGYAASTHAAQGCGQGYHRTIYGGCILNYPGPFARPAPYHPGCWRTMWGHLRCFRR